MSYGVELQRQSRNEHEQPLGGKGDEKARKEAERKASSSVEYKDFCQYKSNEGPGEKSDCVGRCKAQRPVKVEGEIAWYNKSTRWKTENLGKEEVDNQTKPNGNILNHFSPLLPAFKGFRKGPQANLLYYRIEQASASCPKQRFLQ